MSKYGLIGWTQVLSLAMERDGTSAAGGKPGALGRLWQRLLHWQRVSTMRHDLRQMPDYLLRDIGINREQALMEGQPPLGRD